MEGPGPGVSGHTSFLARRVPGKRRLSSLPCQEQRANPLLSIKHSKWDYFIHSFNHGLIIQYMPGTVLDERYNDEQRSTLAFAFLKFTI